MQLSLFGDGISSRSASSGGDASEAAHNGTPKALVEGPFPSTCKYCDEAAAIMYIVQGSLLTLGNFLILISILNHPRLRQVKEYLMVAGLALVDGMGGVATLAAGAGRLRLVLLGKQCELVSRVDCLSRPWNLLFIWTDPLTHIFPLVISFDRLFAVSSPVRYMKLTYRYVLVVFGGLLAFWSVSVFTGVALTLPLTQRDVSALCYTAWSLRPDYYTYHGGIGVFADILCVLIYIFILAIVRRANTVYPAGSSAERQSMRRTRKITTTLGLVSLFTALFYTLPLAGKLVASYYVSQETMRMVLPFTFLVNSINQYANFFLYTTRQKEVRQAVLRFLCCKKKADA